MTARSHALIGDEPEVTDSDSSFRPSLATVPLSLRHAVPRDCQRNASVFEVSLNACSKKNGHLSYCLLLALLLSLESTGILM